MFGSLLTAARNTLKRVGSTITATLKKAFDKIGDTIVVHMEYDINGEACAKLCAWRNGATLTISLSGKEDRDANFRFPPIHPNCDCTVRISR